MAQAPINILEEVERVLRLEAEAILNCAGRIRPGTPEGVAIEKAVGLLNAALNGGGKIIVTGLGKSGKIAQKIAATLCSTGSFAVYLHPTEGLHGDLGVVSAKDVVLALSQTGNTDDLISLIPSLKRLQVPVIAIAGNAQSQLVRAAKVWIDSSIEQEACPHNLTPTTSTTLTLALGDALAVSLMRVRGFNAEAFAKNHPGGALGRRLSLTVSDVMHSGAAVPALPPTASMDEVVVASTRAKMIGVLIVEGSRLIGLITDGDIRRALSHREKFFGLRAADVMTHSPVTVGPEQMAFEALELMENRPSQLSVLPVVDSSGHWKGLVRIHDLLQIF